MNPATVGKIFQEIAGSHAHLHRKGLYIVDLEYNRTGGCSGHEKGFFLLLGSDYERQLQRASMGNSVRFGR